MALPSMNRAPTQFDPETDLPAGFMSFFRPLHHLFTPRQQQLIRHRAEVLNDAHRGRLPKHLPPSAAATSDWKIQLPEWAQDQRNQMTGPADDGELVVKMLNSGAPGVMIDLEDSMANDWSALMRGVENTIRAHYGELSYVDKKRNQTFTIKPSKTVLFTRSRGLHLSQGGIFPNNEITSASLFDVALIAYQLDPTRLTHPICFYIPKSESAEEALWWNDLFKAIEKAKRLATGSIKCMALVESHPLAFQIEEFIYNLRDHLIGMNLGRWDYMASLIHFLYTDPDWVLPDRNTIPHNIPFFQNLRLLIPKICHTRGLLAIGGMTALYPSRIDLELNERALRVLAEDKKNEASCYMDGAWTGHPDQNQIALAQFPFPNQLAQLAPAVPRYPDLRPAVVGVGKRTVNGTRAAIRTVIRYRAGYLNGKGASLLDGYMEDLATDRIYRLMIAQRMKHRGRVEIFDETGKAIRHTPEFITKLFDEELTKVIAEQPCGTDTASIEPFRRAREISEEMIRSEAFSPI